MKKNLVNIRIILISISTLIILVTLSISLYNAYSKNKKNLMTKMVDKQDMNILEIIVPLDNKNDDETHHTSIVYELRQTGQEFDVRNIYDWASQASRRKELNKSELKEVKELINKLPDETYVGEKKGSLIVRTYLEKGMIEKKYKQNALPKELKNIFALLGGIRYELEDKLKFIE